MSGKRIKGWMKNWKKLQMRLKRDKEILVRKDQSHRIGDLKICKKERPQ